jgi:hypothetical protein
MNIETLRNLFRKEQVSTRQITLSLDEQLALEIFEQNRIVNDMNVYLKLNEVREITFGSDQDVDLPVIQELTKNLDQRRYLEFIPEFSKGWCTRRITKKGRNAIKQIRRQKGAFRRPLTINIPVEVEK